MQGDDLWGFRNSMCTRMLYFFQTLPAFAVCEHLRNINPGIFPKKGASWEFRQHNPKLGDIQGRLTGTVTDLISNSWWKWNVFNMRSWKDGVMWQWSETLLSQLSSAWHRVQNHSWKTPLAGGSYFLIAILGDSFWFSSRTPAISYHYTF